MGLTQDTLAKLIEVDRRTIIRWESGDRVPVRVLRHLEHLWALKDICKPPKPPAAATVALDERVVELISEHSLPGVLASLGRVTAWQLAPHAKQETMKETAPRTPTCTSARKMKGSRLDWPCPFCNAQPGQPCVGPRGGIRAPHTSREVEEDQLDEIEGRRPSGLVL
jgi:transcriptional regulator with XRE-family HTH domain